MKNHFDHKDNVLDKTLVRYIDSQCFMTSCDLKTLTKNILYFYSQILYNGDKKRAIEDLNGQHNEIRKKDAILISFFGGATASVTIFLIVFLIIRPGEDGEEDWNELYSGIVIFQFLLAIILVLVFSGMAI